MHEKHAGPPPFVFPPVFAEWLASLPPVDRARVAAALSDRRAQPLLAAVAGEAVWGLTCKGGGGLSHAEIAGLLGCGQDAVARRVLRHRKAVGLTRGALTSAPNMARSSGRDDALPRKVAVGRKGTVGAVADASPESLAAKLKWLGTEDCPCAHEWKSLGRLHGVSMGKGWVRTTTVAECPHHGVEAERRRRARRR